MQDYSLSFELKELLPGLNKVLRMHWRKRNSIYKAVYTTVDYLTLGKRPSTPLTKYAITFTRHTIRPLDIDNLVASFKPVLDSLVLSGVIKDDKWSMTDNVFYKQRKVSKMIEQKISVEVNSK